MPDKRLFTEWEEQSNCMVSSVPAEMLTQSVTKEEFDAIAFQAAQPAHGVNHADRIQFLIENGYAVTRENMLDHTLSHKVIEEEEQQQ